MSFTKVAPTGIGTSPGNSILIGDSLLHSTGIDIGSNTGIGVTIRKHGDATFTGIITAANISAASSVTATEFYGDGSNLDGVSSSGIGTALNDDDTNVLNKIYYVNQELSIGSTVTVNHPDTGTASYTHYQDLVVKNDADFIVADGDTFIPDILGITTSTSTASAATGGRIRAGTITNAGANGAPNFPNGLTGTAGTFTGAITAASGTITGNLGVAGVLTYEDVTNVDSVGVITARSGIRIGATGANTLITGNGIGIGIGITTPQEELHIRAATPVIRLEDGDNARQSQIVGSDGNFRFDADNSNAIADTNIAFRTDGSERLRIGSAGQIGIAGANYGTSGQVLTSQGSGSAVQWATPAAGWVHGTEVTLPTNASYYTFTNVPDGASHIRYLIRYMSFAGVAQAKMQVEKSTTGGSKSIITSNYVAYSNYLYNNGNAGGGNTDGMDLFDSYSNPANSFFGSVNVYRIGSSGSDGTNYFFEHQGVNIGSGGSSEAVFQSNGYIELGSNTTDFISGVKFWANTGENFDNGYIQQSYLLS